MEKKHNITKQNKKKIGTQNDDNNNCITNYHSNYPKMKMIQKKNIQRSAFFSFVFYKILDP